ncbi:outer membrane biogenesis protein BamB [Novipirellula galeiformis]|uniref:Outer membrane biogenesis protein BamB n=1 Tax=Novipirellula galeiformis TaxID=2528004 RepID=A0A5C6BFJ7_9BACT|nr:PQQ-binding-like beta-propeller repeat protein [Novipirellula galeiformis]TWU10059.1 outer membrane biogenesis protein BamB [Novipirellula galeiformis]
MNRVLLLTLTPLLLLSSGCGRKNPVEEITAARSNVKIVDVISDKLMLPWPAWRGPQHDGVVPDQPLLTHWSEEQNVVWRTEVPGRGHSSPIVVANTVYLATAIQDPQKQQVLAFDGATGKSKWTTDVHTGGFPSERAVHHKATHANGTLACDGVRLYTAFLNSDAIVATALDLDGNVVWQREIGKFVSKFGYAPSPVLYKSLVIFAADNMGGGYLAAVDGESGEIAWRVARGNISSYSSPTVANVGGRDQLLISGCGAVTSFDPASGEKRWSTPCTAEATCGTVVTSADRIFASGGYPEKETTCLSANGEKIWSVRTKAYEPSLVLNDDRLFVVNDEGVAYCWDADTGDVIWRERLGGNFSASPIVCNDVVYVSNLSGETFVFENEKDTFKLISTNQLGDDAYASPAVAESQMFLRVGVDRGTKRHEQLVCLESKDP